MKRFFVFLFLVSHLIISGLCFASRCCYNDGSACQDVTLAECTSLDGIWDSTMTCASCACVIYSDTLWKHTYGGTADDELRSIQYTADGGFIMAGYTASFGAGGHDMYIVKTNGSGSIEWTRTLGGTQDDEAFTVRQLPDGGYLAVGTTYSFNGWSDLYFVRLSSAGDTIWTRAFDTGNFESMRGSVNFDLTSDGGFIVTGFVFVSPTNAEDFAFWKFDSNGNLQWSRTYGGPGDDDGRAVRQTADGGYIFAGKRYLNGNCGFVMRTNSTGDSLWTRYTVGRGDDQFRDVIQTSDGGFLAFGSSWAYSGLDWLVYKYNSDGDSIWAQTSFFGGGTWAGGVVESAQGGYVLAGGTEEPLQINMCQAKLDTSGNIEWQHTYGGCPQECSWANAICATPDHRYALAGKVRPPNEAAIGSGFVILTPAETSLPVGRCCYNSSTACQNVTLAECIALGGSWDSTSTCESCACAILTDSTWTRAYGGSGDELVRSIQQTSDSGFIMVGYTTSFGAGGRDVYLIKTNSDGITQWSRTYGGLNNDEGYAVRQTADGGYIITGWTDSFSGCADAYLIRTNSMGDTLWTKRYDQGRCEYARGLDITGDGGYILIGHQYPGDLGDDDYYLWKINPDGSVQWTRTYGSVENDEGRAIRQTVDGGYVFVGARGSLGDVYRLNAGGDIVWMRSSCGGSDNFNDVQQTTDGGFIVAGDSWNYSFLDVLVYKFAANGDSVWARTSFGSSYTRAEAVIQSSDGGYVLAGVTRNSPDQDDMFLLKLDADGYTIWARSFGSCSGSWDLAWSVCETNDHRYVLAGETRPTGGSDSYDVLVVKTSIDTPPPIARCCYNNGNSCADLTQSHCVALGGIWDPASTCATQACVPAPDSCWSKTFGGAGYDGGTGIIELDDCGFMMAGYRNTTDFGDQGQIIRTTLTADTIWTRLYGGSQLDRFNEVVQLSDSEFVAVGYTLSSGAGSYDGWFVKCDENGDTLWTLVIGGAASDQIFDVVGASDGSIWAVGFTNSFGAGLEDVWIVHVSNSGVLLSSQTIGGPGTDRSWGIAVDSDGYVVAAENGSVGGISWLIKLDQNGDSLWSQTYSGALGYTGHCSPTQAQDGYYIAGRSTVGGTDFWLARTDLQGNLVWQRNYGGSDGEYLTYEFLLDESGILLGGSTYSFGSGGADYWVIRTDLNGALLWSKSLGGPGDDLCFARTKTSDGGYALLGRSNSFGAGSFDWWLVKLGACIPAPPQVVEVVISQNNPDIQLHWKPVTQNTSGCAIQVDSYTVYSSASIEGPFEPLATVIDTFYVHSGVIPTQGRLYYEVRANENPPALMSVRNESQSSAKMVERDRQAE